jgi:hypothetical protein
VRVAERVQAEADQKAAVERARAAAQEELARKMESVAREQEEQAKRLHALQVRTRTFLVSRFLLLLGSFLCFLTVSRRRLCAWKCVQGGECVAQASGAGRAATSWNRKESCQRIIY